MVTQRLYKELVREVGRNVLSTESHFSPSQIWFQTPQSVQILLLCNYELVHGGVDVEYDLSIVRGSLKVTGTRDVPAGDSSLPPNIREGCHYNPTDRFIRGRLSHDV